MIYLILVSLIWAFSFGLIKGQLNGLDSHFIAFARLALSFIFFAFFLRTTIFKSKQIKILMGIGAVQFGLMYILYIYAYNFLDAWQIALFTIFTPLYVVLIGDLIRKRFQVLYLLVAIMSVAGAAIIIARDLMSVELRTGFVLMQLSNMCFAAGQVWYKKVKADFKGIKDGYLFSWLYAGALLVSGVNSMFITDWSSLQINSNQIMVLLYLGILSSGICFFLWNYGATKVNNGTLAVLNNLKVPLGVLISITVFGENGDWKRLLLGGTVIFAAIIINEFFKNKAPVYSFKSK
ncbi:MAG: EamA family transporter [Calditrichae bacterium]|nr:EamA family transporter [Calditrichia bacterium]